METTVIIDNDLLIEAMRAVLKEGLTPAELGAGSTFGETVYGRRFQIPVLDQHPRPY